MTTDQTPTKNHPRKYRVEMTRVERHYSDATVTIEADSEREAWVVASELTEFEVDFEEKPLDLDVEYFVEAIEETDQ